MQTIQSLSSYGPFLGWCIILHWDTRKFRKCYYMWMKNTVVITKGFSLRVPLMVQSAREANTLESFWLLQPSSRLHRKRVAPAENREEWSNGEYLPFLPAIADVTPLEDSSRCEKNDHQSPQKAIFLSPTYEIYCHTPLLHLLFYFSISSHV